jgi:CRISPR-associated endonuclease/helicase Cas3
LYYAHSTKTADASDWQPLQDHLRQTALRAEVFGRKFGAAKAAALAGWLHDLGKYSGVYQAYIAGRGPGGIDHSTAGAQEVRKLSLKGSDNCVAELIAYVIAGHHAGLPDMTGADGESSALADRLKKTVPPLDPIWQREVRTDLSGLFPAGLKPVPKTGGFQLGFLGRMIFPVWLTRIFSIPRLSMPRWTAGRLTGPGLVYSKKSSA